MSEIDDEKIIEPYPLSPEHSRRFVTGYRKAPVEFEEVLQNPQGQEPRRVRNKDSVRNYYWLITISSLLFVGLLLRTANLQITQGERFRGLAEGNRLRSIVLNAPRGVLYDRNNVQLVKNIPNYELVMVPVDIPRDEETRKSMFIKLESIAGVKSQDLQTLYAKQDRNSFDAVPVGQVISRETALWLQTKAEEFPGMKSQVQALREYAYAEPLSNLVGYVGKLTAEEAQQNPDYVLTDNIGKAGIEQFYESTLKGKNGSQNVEVDAYGKIVNILATRQSTSGADLTLTIDTDLQKKLYETLNKAAVRSGKKRAAAVVINPQNGEILAMVSVPGYDLNVFAKGEDNKKIQSYLKDPNQPLFTRPVSGSYPPGSTFKPFVATGALQAGNITENTTFFDTGIIKIGQQVFKGWKPGGHGEVNVISAIANSVNGFFFSIGGGYEKIDGIGIAGIDKIAQAFGFGKTSEVDLPGEAKGLLPTPEWKEKNYQDGWYLGDTYNASIGQGFVLVTPLQLANATAALANGGILYWPHVAKEVHKADGSVEMIQSKVINDKIADQKNINIVREGMRAAVTSGTGRLLASLPVPAAGKTGTAQFGTGEPNAWFTAFAPYDKPTIAIAVLVEQAGEGSDYSAPVAQEVLNYYFTKNKP